MLAGAADIHSLQLTLVSRLDLEYAIFTGTRPFLFDESSPSIHGIHLAATTAGHTEQGVARDARLEAVFRETQALVTAINIAVGTGTKLDLTFFQESMLTTQYRILLLEFPESEWEMEALRLGMIAFGTTVYFRFAEYGREYRHLSEMLATVVKGHPPGDWPRPELVFWLLIVGSISLWKPGSQHFVLEGLEELTYRLNIRSWAEAKALLKSILWIDSLHDDLVRAEFGGLDLPFRFG